MLFIYINNSPSNYLCAFAYTLSFCSTRPSSGIVLNFGFFECFLFSRRWRKKRISRRAAWISLDGRPRLRRRRASPYRCCRCCWFRFRYQIKFTFKVSGDQRSLRLDVRHAFTSGIRLRESQHKMKAKEERIPTHCRPFCHLFLSRILSVFWFIHFVTLFHSHRSYPLRM